MSYIIDVYNGKIKAERHFGIYALYVSFFPQLVAGPIERPSALMPQFYEEKIFSYNCASKGMLQIAFGFFMKLCIADELGLFVDEVYDDVTVAFSLQLMLAAVMFSFQIYCDFAGYSLIAIGVANLLGFKLSDNFKSSYFACSITDFWRRWHISLTSWFTDYVYIPLGGNRVKKIRWKFNIILTLLLSGLWHGANWTFIIWGIGHGILQIISKKIKSVLDKVVLRKEFICIRKFIGCILTFFVVTFMWIFFRATSINEALYVIKEIFTWNSGELHNAIKLLEIKRSYFVGLIPLLLIVASVDYASLRYDLYNKLLSVKK